MMTDHETIDAAVSRELTADEWAEWTQRVGETPGLAEQQARQQRMHQALGVLLGSDEADHKVVQSVLADLQGKSPEVLHDDVLADRRLQQPRRVRWPVALAAAAAVLGAVGIWWWGPARGDVVARAEPVSGVSVQVSGGRKITLNPGDEVRSGARIETGADAKLVLTYAGAATRVSLRENSKFEIRNSKLSVLETGDLTAQVAKQESGSPFVIETPHATASVRGTRFGLQVSSDTRHSTLDTPAYSRLDVEEGWVMFADLLGGSVVVNAGEYGVAEKGRPVVAFPAGVDYETAAADRRNYHGGLVVFKDDFEGAAQGWLPLIAESGSGGEQKDRLKLVRSGMNVPRKQIGVATLKGDDRTLRMLRIHAPAGDKRWYGAWGQYNPAMRCYSLAMKVLRQSGQPGPVPSQAIVSGVRLPPGVTPRLLAGALHPALPLNKLTDVRLEYIMTMADEETAILDAKTFHDGRLRSWTQARGPAEDFAGELLVSVVNGTVYLDDVVVQRLIPGRVTDGLLVLYCFDEGKGTTIHDRSGSGTPLHLTIRDSNHVRWLKHGIAINGPARISSAMSGKIPSAWQRNQSLTIEWWTKPSLKGSQTQERCAMVNFRSRKHVFTQSQIVLDLPDDAKLSSHHQIMTLSEKGGEKVARLYAYGKALGDVPMEGPKPTSTFSGGAVCIQIPGGSTQSAKSGYANWTGECYVLAIYGRALRPDEVWQNFLAGVPGVTDPRQ